MITKKWTLLLPDWSKLDTLWRTPKPFALWPVGDKPFIAHWMDQAVNEEIDTIVLYTADRPNELRQYLRDGEFWSRKVKIVPIQSDEKAPEDAIPVLGLPHSNRIDGSIQDGGDLLRHWLKLNQIWLDTANPYVLRIETKYTERGWIGPKTRIHPTATLVPPFWIQEHCEIGAGVRIGPYACIAENCIIDDNAIVRDSIVLAGTHVGKNTELDRVAVDGGLLLDSKHSCRVPIVDSFILSQVESRQKPTPLLDRAFSLLLMALLWPFALIANRNYAVETVHDGNGGYLSLKTAQEGPLFLRRYRWLKEVFKGRMQLIGILPRPAEWTIDGIQEVEQRLKETKPGVLSLSDVHGCHSPSDPDEWTHAAYQAFDAAQGVSKIVRANLWKIALSRNVQKHA